MVYIPDWPDVKIVFWFGYLQMKKPLPGIGRRKSEQVVKKKAAPDRGGFD
jgi:hypothetical protein